MIILSYSRLLNSTTILKTLNCENVSILLYFDDKEKIVWVDDNPIIFPGGVVIDIQ